MQYSKSFLDQLGIVSYGHTNEAQAKSFVQYENWVKQSYHYPLNYLSDHRKVKRKSLESVYPRFKQAVVFLFSYASIKKAMQKRKRKFNIAGYAVGFSGKDYHHVIKERLLLAYKKIKAIDSSIGAKVVVDTDAVLERDLAYRAGLGWFGKNSMLINQFHGSYVMIGTLLLSKVFFKGPPIRPSLDHCGNCTKCIEACPTDAIDGTARTINSAKCISTYTIELFKESTSLPPPHSSSQTEVFGCDICQDVCPWNVKEMKKDYSRSSELSLHEVDSLLDFFCERDGDEIIADLNSMSNRGFKRKFKKTAFERTGREGVAKNYRAIIPNSLKDQRLK